MLYALRNTATIRTDLKSAPDSAARDPKETQVAGDGRRRTSPDSGSRHAVREPFMSHSMYQPFVRNALVALVMIGLAVPLQGHAQIVRGEVIDVEYGSPVSLVDISILGKDDEVLRTTTTDAEGRFLVGTRQPGEYRLRAERLGYQAVTTEPFAFQADSVLEVVVRMSSEAIALDPLEVVGRGESEINRATFEGLYQRRARSPSVGSNRVWTRSDPEMDDLLTVREFIRRYTPTIKCPDYLIRGIDIPRDFREVWLNSPVYALEGIEVYRRSYDAPLGVRTVGARRGGCGIVVIWPQRMGDEPW